MTNTERRKHHRAIRALGPHQSGPGTPTEHLWLLVPEGLEHDDEVVEQSIRLGCNGIVSPHEGRSSLHDEAARAGLDVSIPVLYRPPPSPPPEPSYGERLAALEAELRKR